MKLDFYIELECACSEFCWAEKQLVPEKFSFSLTQKRATIQIHQISNYLSTSFKQENKKSLTQDQAIQYTKLSSLPLCNKAAAFKEWNSERAPGIWSTKSSCHWGFGTPISKKKKNRNMICQQKNFVIKHVLLVSEVAGRVLCFAGETAHALFWGVFCLTALATFRESQVSQTEQSKADSRTLTLWTNKSSVDKENKLEKEKSLLKGKLSTQKKTILKMTTVPTIIPLGRELQGEFQGESLNWSKRRRESSIAIHHFQDALVKRFNVNMAFADLTVFLLSTL